MGCPTLRVLAGYLFKDGPWRSIRILMNENNFLDVGTIKWFYLTSRST
jgi:hypothetical protein